MFVFEREDGYVKFLTKGDNNSVDDRGLYVPGQFWLERKDVIGKAKGFVPYIGMVTIIMNDYPQLKVNNYTWNTTINSKIVINFYLFKNKVCNISYTRYFCSG